LRKPPSDIDAGSLGAAESKESEGMPGALDFLKRNANQRLNSVVRRRELRIERRSIDRGSFTRRHPLLPIKIKSMLTMTTTGSMSG